MPEQDYQKALAELAGGDEELVGLVRNEIRSGRLTERTYAKVFALMYFTRMDAAQCVSYSKASAQWRWGKKPISEIRVYGLVANACDLIRLVILASWQDCLVSVLASEKVLQKLETDLDGMEKLERVKEMLAIAGTMMVYTNSDGQFNWGSQDAAEEGGAQRESEARK